METPSEVCIDEAFVQAPEHRPKPGSTAEARDIPSIDLSKADQEELARDVGDACREWGFLEVTNHGVAAGVLRRAEAAARAFFPAAGEERRRVRRDEVRVLGFYDNEYTKNVRDWKEVFEFCVQEPVLVPASAEDGEERVTEWWNQWPERPAEFREACEEYGKEVQKLSTRLMGLIALSLGLPENRFDRFFKDQTSFVRLNHYPTCPISHLALGIGAHKDSPALTILAQDNVGGLQVKRKTDGEWIRVKPNPDAFIVNVGDIIQVWSNEKYESVEHRVVANAERERFSIPFLLGPSHYTMVEPLEELTDERNPPKYRPYNWGKFHVTRRSSNFRKPNGEKIQIHHFRVPE